MKRSFVVAAPILMLVFAACSDSTSPAQISPADIDQAAVLSASDATAEDVNLLAASDMTMSGGAVADMIGPGLQLSRISLAESGPSYSWTFGDGCTRSPSGRFTCPAITNNGLTLNRDYAFYDANGTMQAAYNATTTASANFHVSVTGTHTVDNGEDVVNRDRNLTVTGLAGAETFRIWNGTGTRDDHGSRTFGDVTRTYETSDNVTVSDVKVNLPRSSNPWPVSGSITRVISGTASVTRNGITRSFSVDRTVTITFDGTQNAMVTVGNDTYTLDLTTGVATKN